MSRNLRHRESPPPAQKTVRRNSTTSDGSSDDDYGGVDLISDSDEDEPDVEVAEEQAIIESAEDDDDDVLQSDPRPSIEDDQNSWDGIDMDSQEVLGEDVPFFDEQMARMNAPDHDTVATVWNATNSQSDDEDEAEASPETSRRVRFDLSESSAGSDDDDDLFPDIFLDQSSLDPAFRRIIESGDDNDDAGASSEEGSYWDFQGSDPGAGPEQSDAEASDSSTGSSGYESGLHRSKTEAHANVK